MNSEQFGQFLQQVRKSSSFSAKELSDKLKLHRNTIQSYEKNGRLPDIDFLAGLALQTGHSLIKLLVKRVEASNLDPLEKQTILEQLLHLEILSESTQIQETGATYQANSSIQFDGDNMAPTISEGATITIDKSDRELTDGKVYLFELNNHFHVYRIQHQLNGETMLSNDNKAYSNQQLPDMAEEVTIVGKVVATYNPL